MQRASFRTHHMQHTTSQMLASFDPETLIRTYIRAKDENRPHLMAQTFASDATLQMTVNSSAITFPARSEGVAAITDVLVRRFGQTYDNVYTFCLADSRPVRGVTRYSCDWLVGMSDKLTDAVRVGCGSYVWTFSGHEQGQRVQTLDIVIEAMEVLPPETSQPVFDSWLVQLPYPWCTIPLACERIPTIAQLEPVLAALRSRNKTGCHFQ